MSRVVLRRACSRAWRALAACCLLLASQAGTAGPPTTLRAPPGLLDKVGITQNLGARVPLSTTFRDAAGHAVKLGDLFDGKPVLLVPGYYGCINLCSVVRAGVAKAVAASGLVPGRQFDVVLVSIDPDETPRTASTTQRNDAAVHAGAHIGQWHYLTGTRAASRKVMDAIGYRYFHDTRNGQYDHDAGIVVVSPNGRVAQYLFGVKFAPETLRLALVAASHGKIGNLVDHFLLVCCNYDPSTGRYSLVIHRIMQILGIATALTLCVLIAVLLRAERRRTRRQGEGT